MKRDEQPGGARPFRSWPHVLLIVVIWAVPLAGLAIALPLSDHLERLHNREPLSETIEVGSREDDSRTAITVELQTVEGESVEAAVSGTVTAVTISPGDPVVQGAVLVSVDYAPVVLFQMASPLVRDLSLGDSGQDVSVLGKYLVQLDMLQDGRAGSKVDWTFRNAIVAFQKKHGFPPDGVFRTAYVAFAPPSVTHVGIVSVAVGQNVNAGTVIFAAPNSPIDATIASASPGASTAEFRDAVVLVAGNEHLKLASINPTAEELAPLAAWLQAQAASGSIGTDDADARTALFDGLFLTAARPQVVGVVPASAVLLAKDGSACVFVVEGEEISSEKLSRAAPVVGEVGTVGIDGELIGSAVLRDPAMATERVTSRCG